MSSGHNAVKTGRLNLINSKCSGLTLHHELCSFFNEDLPASWTVEVLSYDCFILVMDLLFIYFYKHMLCNTGYVKLQAHKQ